MCRGDILGPSRDLGLGQHYCQAMLEYMPGSVDPGAGEGACTSPGAPHRLGLEFRHE